MWIDWFCGMIKQGVDYTELTKELKAQLLTIPVLETHIAGKRSPLMVAVGQTTAPCISALVESCAKFLIRKCSYGPI